MKKLIPVIVIVLILSATSPVWVFMIGAAHNSFENSQKKEEFISRAPEQIEELIQVCQNLASSHKEWTYLDADSTPNIPQELKKFGFYRAIIHEEKVSMTLFSSFDSRGDVVCDWTDPNRTKVYFVEGDQGQLITPIYETEGRSSQSYQLLSRSALHSR